MPLPRIYRTSDGPPAVMIVIELERAAPIIGTNAAGQVDAQRLHEWICSQPHLQSIVHAAWDAVDDAEASKASGEDNL